MHPIATSCGPAASSVRRDSLAAPASDGGPGRIPAHVPVHYTHDDYERGHAACVQVKLGHAVFCAVILKPWTTNDGWHMFKVQLVHHGAERSIVVDGVRRELPVRVTEASVPVFKVRQCSGIDGHCACAHERGIPAGRGPACGESPAGISALVDPASSQAGVVAPPESLTHETSPVSGRS